MSSALRRGLVLLLLLAVAPLPMCQRARSAPGLPRSPPGRRRGVRCALEGASEGRVSPQAACAPAEGVHGRTQSRIVRRGRVRRAMAGDLPRRTGRSCDRHRGPERDADRRARPHRVVGRHDPGRPPDARADVVRGPGGARRTRGVEDLFRARRRAHPAGHRPPAVRAGTAVPGGQLEAPGRHGDCVHGCAQHHARRGHARSRARGAGTGRGDDRIEHHVRCGGDHSRRTRSAAAGQLVRRGWWRSCSACCTASVSPARCARSACRRRTFRWRCCSSTSVSKSASCCSSWPSSRCSPSSPGSCAEQGSRDHGPWHSESLIRTPVAYAIGSVAAFWTVQRVVGFWP